MRVGVEIGGTFTDLVTVDDDGNVTTCKVLSTPKAPADGALNALRESGKPMKDVEVLIHGSTVATNAVLERRGAVTGLITTKGFRDVLEIQRHERYRVYDLYYQKTVPLVPRYLVLEVEERIAADGAIIQPLQNTKELANAIGKLINEEDLASLAVVLLNSYKNPVHEATLGEMLRIKFPQIPLTLSTEVLPEFREYERASTTVMSAYLKPVIQHYMETFESGLSNMGFSGDLHIMQSNGGIFPINAAQQQAVNVILSGPAAGVVGAAYVAEAAGYSNIITLDMGGTSTDVCLVQSGKPSITTDNQIDGLPIRVPMVEIITVGAGGGSIAYKDPGGMLKVGPESAGADPGPSCYGKGGNLPTVTDANVVRGMIRPNKFFGGKLPLRTDLANTAISELAGDLGMDTLTLAKGIEKVAGSNMVDAIRLASLERGHDPRDYTLVAFGGAGGLHACNLAEELEIEKVLIPENPGLLSAYGLLVSDFKRGFVQTEMTRGVDIRNDRVIEVFSELEHKGREEFDRFRVSQKGFTLVPSIDMRYLGQDLSLNVEIDLSRIPFEGLKKPIEAFHQDYTRRCGHCFPEAEVEIVNYRLTVVVSRDPPPIRKKTVSGSPSSDVGKLFVDGAFKNCAYYVREQLPAGFSMTGPLVVEEATATTFIPSNWRMEVDSWGNLILTHG